MLMIDTRENAGANSVAVTAAFASHGLQLDDHTMMMPSLELSGRAPALAASDSRSILTSASRRDIVSAVGEVTGQRFFVEAARIGARTVARVRHRHYVQLDDVDDALVGVEARVESDVLVGELDGRPRCSAWRRELRTANSRQRSMFWVSSRPGR